MTYEQWINSAYNTTGKNFTRTSDGYYVTTTGDEMLTWWIDDIGVLILSQTVTEITEGDILSIDIVGDIGDVPSNYFILNFATSNVNYYVREGMTWSEFINSKLNKIDSSIAADAQFEVDSDNIVGFGQCIYFAEITADMIELEEQTYGSDVIKEDSQYIVNMW